MCLNNAPLNKATYAICGCAHSQNEEAEELMRKVEREEEISSLQHPDKQCLHLCIINLVIGTLYCSKVGG